MKHLKIIFALVLPVLFLTSCTNVSLDEDVDPSVNETIFATGDEQDVDDGTGKD